MWPFKKKVKAVDASAISYCHVMCQLTRFISKKEAVKVAKGLFGNRLERVYGSNTNLESLLWSISRGEWIAVKADELNKVHKAVKKYRKYLEIADTHSTGIHVDPSYMSAARKQLLNQKRKELDSECQHCEHEVDKPADWGYSDDWDGGFEICCPNCGASQLSIEPEVVKLEAVSIYEKNAA